MAAFFTSDELAHLTQPSLAYATLAQFDFASGTQRYFAGAGIRDFGGHEWKGLGGVISISGMGDQRGTAANPVDITLSGVDEALLPKALGETDEVRNRLVTIFWQLLSTDHQPFGRLIPMFWGLMQPPSVNRSEASDDAGPTCTITLPCEGLMVGRARPPSGRYTNADQQRRHPGDRYFERIHVTKGQSVLWPIAD
jgi:hypothetical protein